MVKLVKAMIAVGRSWPSSHFDSRSEANVEGEAGLQHFRCGRARFLDDAGSAGAAFAHVAKAEHGGREQDAAVAEIEKMARGHLAGFLVGDGDGVGLGAVGDAVGDHVGNAGPFDEVAIGEAVGGGNDDDAGRAPGENGGEPRAFRFLVVIGIGDDDLIVLLADAAFDRRDDGGEERVVEIGTRKAMICALPVRNCEARRSVW